MFRLRHHADAAQEYLAQTSKDRIQSILAELNDLFRSYVLKGARHDEMQRASQAAGSGEAIFSPTIATE